MRERTVTFSGTDLVADMGLVYSSFEETIPQPKVIKVSIPAGADMDITEAVGPVAYTNGEHVFKFLIYGDTQEERLERKRNVLALIHGRYEMYRLSWDPDYYYTGRVSCEVEHLFDNADVLTITVDRYPWKVGDQISVDINSHPSASYRLQGSERYSDVSIVLRQQASVKLGTDAAQTLAAGTHTLAGQVYGEKDVVVTVSDWWQYLDGTNLVVNTSKYSLSGTNATFNSDWVLNGTDLYCASEAKQHSTLRFTRKDL